MRANRVKILCAVLFLMMAKSGFSQINLEIPFSLATGEQVITSNGTGANFSGTPSFLNVRVTWDFNPFSQWIFGAGIYFSHFPMQSLYAAGTAEYSFPQFKNGGNLVLKAILNCGFSGQSYTKINQDNRTASLKWSYGPSYQMDLNLLYQNISVSAWYFGGGFGVNISKLSNWKITENINLFAGYRFRIK